MNCIVALPQEKNRNGQLTQIRKLITAKKLDAESKNYAIAKCGKVGKNRSWFATRKPIGESEIKIFSLKINYECRNK